MAQPGAAPITRVLGAAFGPDVKIVPAKTTSGGTIGPLPSTTIGRGTSTTPASPLRTREVDPDPDFFASRVQDKPSYTSEEIDGLRADFAVMTAEQRSAALHAVYENSPRQLVAFLQSVEANHADPGMFMEVASSQVAPGGKRQAASFAGELMRLQGRAPRTPKRALFSATYLQSQRFTLDH